MAGVPLFGKQREEGHYKFRANRSYLERSRFNNDRRLERWIHGCSSRPLNSSPSKVRLTTSLLATAGTRHECGAYTYMQALVKTVTHVE